MFTCAVTWHGALYTWGSGARGQLGTGSLQESWDRSVFVPVAKSGNSAIFLKRFFSKAATRVAGISVNQSCWSPQHDAGQLGAKGGDRGGGFRVTRHIILAIFSRQSHFDITILYMFMYIHTYMHACIHPCIHTYIHAYIHT